MTDNHFATFANGNVVVFAIDDAHFEAGLRPAHCARIDMSRLLVGDQDFTHLGHAPTLDQGKPKALLERSMDRWLKPCSKTKADFVITILWTGRLVQKHRDNNAKIVDDCRLGLADFAPPAGSAEAFRHNLGAASEQHSVERDDAGVDVKQR